MANFEHNVRPFLVSREGRCAVRPFGRRYLAPDIGMTPVKKRAASRTIRRLFVSIKRLLSIVSRLLVQFESRRVLCFANADSVCLQKELCTMRDTNTSRDTVFFCYHSRQGVKYPVRGRKQGSGPPCAVEARSQ